jgi:hypothetical protein
MKDLVGWLAQADDSLASSNLVHVVGHLYGCRLLEVETLYSLLDHLRDRLGRPLMPSSIVITKAMSSSSWVSSLAHRLSEPLCSSSISATPLCGRWLHSLLSKGAG